MRFVAGQAFLSLGLGITGGSLPAYLVLLGVCVRLGLAYTLSLPCARCALQLSQTFVIQ